MATPRSALVLPRPVERRIAAAARSYLHGATTPAYDFSRPVGAPALVGPDSVSWRVFKNPVALFIGGVAAVLLELAEPQVRTGVWEHSDFRREPGARLRSTGLAAMIQVYGPREAAEAMIAGVGRRHARVVGETPAGEAYRADDPVLLTWVQATAAFGFTEAYSRYVRPLSSADRARLHGEGVKAASLWGAVDAPRSEAALQALFARMDARLEASPIIFEFLDIMRTAKLFPAPLRPIQAVLVRAAVALLPAAIRARLGLGAGHGPRPGEVLLVRAAAALADRMVIESSPAVQACRRLGLPADHLYRGRP